MGGRASDGGHLPPYPPLMPPLIANERQSDEFHYFRFLKTKTQFFFLRIIFTYPEKTKIKTKRPRGKYKHDKSKMLDVESLSWHLFLNTHDFLFRQGSLACSNQ